MPGLKQQLNDFLKVEGIKSAVIVGRDGFVIEGVTSDGNLEVEAVGAILSTGLGTSEVMGRELNVGKLSQSMVEYDNGVLVMGKLGTDALLCIVCEQGSNLGNVRLQVKKRSPNLLADL